MVVKRKRRKRRTAAEVAANPRTKKGILAKKGKKKVKKKFAKNFKKTKIVKKKKKPVEFMYARFRLDNFCHRCNGTMEIVISWDRVTVECVYCKLWGKLSEEKSKEMIDKLIVLLDDYKEKI